MERKFQMTAEGIVVYILMPVTPSEQEKLECKDLERTITNIAKDLHVDWAVETTGVTISKTFGPLIGNAQVSEADVAANTFMSAIRQLDIPKKHLAKVQDVDDNEPDELDDAVVVFTAGNNTAQVIKALRECTCTTLEIAKRCAKNGRLVCDYRDVEKIMDNLEVAGARNIHIDEQLTNDLNFCKDILADWDETDEMAQTTGAIILCGTRNGHLQMPCGLIDEKLLQSMFIAYIQSM